MKKLYLILVAMPVISTAWAQNTIISNSTTQQTAMTAKIQAVGSFLFMGN